MLTYWFLTAILTASGESLLPIANPCVSLPLSQLWTLSETLIASRGASCQVMADGEGRRRVEWRGGNGRCVVAGGAFVTPSRRPSAHV